MKKLLLIAALFAQIKFYGQALPNGTFENWSTIAYEEPNTWNSGNLRDIQRMGMATITKVTGFSGFAIRIQTNISGPDTSESYIINTNNPCSDPPQWTGGVPYTQQPTGISGYYRYNLPGNDTAIMIVVFRKNGVHIGDNLIKIRGTGSQSTFAAFNFTLNCAGVPDTMIIAAASSNKMSNTGISNGSYIELDNLAFVGATQAIPNGNFENWTSKTCDKPNSWACWGSGVSKTTTSYAGIYSLRLETMAEMCGGYNSSGITTGYMTPNNGPDGGRPYTLTSDTLLGYYKYAPAGNDTAYISISLTKNNSNVGGGWRKLVASGSFIPFKIPINSGITPDTIRIDIQSSGWPTVASNVGSVLYVDNIYLKSQPLGLRENILSDFSLQAFPNPAGDVLYIKSERNLPAQQLVIYNYTGVMAKSQEVASGSNLLRLDVSDLPIGIYFYELKASDGNAVRCKFIKQ